MEQINYNIRSIPIKVKELESSTKKQVMLKSI